MKTKNLEATTYKNQSILRKIFKIECEMYLDMYWDESSNRTDILECISVCEAITNTSCFEKYQEMKQFFPKATEHILLSSSKNINGFTIYYDEESFFEQIFPDGESIAKKALKNFNCDFVISAKPCHLDTESEFDTAIDIVTTKFYAVDASNVSWIGDKKLLVRSANSTKYFEKSTYSNYGTYGIDYM